MRVYLHTKFQVSSIILASFRGWEGGLILPPPTAKRTPKKSTLIGVETIKQKHEKLRLKNKGKRENCC